MDNIIAALCPSSATLCASWQASGPTAPPLPTVRLVHTVKVHQGRGYRVHVRGRHVCCRRSMANAERIARQVGGAVEVLSWRRKRVTVPVEVDLVSPDGMGFSVSFCALGAGRE